MEIRYPAIGVCGLSCRLCPNYHRETASRCEVCKSQGRMAVGCSFIACAVRKKEIEFCWQCEDSETCERWRQHRESGRNHDSFKCYQTLDQDLAFVREHGVGAFERAQEQREGVLREMLAEFNEGRSKTYYCIAATVMDMAELREVLGRAREQSTGLDTKARSILLHSMLDEIARRKGYLLKLRR